MSKRNTVQKVGQNIIDKYGAARFARLIELFQADADLGTVAEEFGVSKQRVHQWRKTLGDREILYNPKLETQELLNQVQYQTGNHVSI